MLLHANFGWLCQSPHVFTIALAWGHPGDLVSNLGLTRLIGAACLICLIKRWSAGTDAHHFSAGLKQHITASSFTHDHLAMLWSSGPSETMASNNHITSTTHVQITGNHHKSDITCTVPQRHQTELLYCTMAQLLQKTKQLLTDRVHH